MNKTFFVYLIISLNALNANNYDNQIDSFALEYEEQVIEWRHWFHANPELSNREFNTSKRIAEILNEIGYSPKTGIAKTGVVAILDGGKPGPVVA